MVVKCSGVVVGGHQYLTVLPPKSAGSFHADLVTFLGGDFAGFKRLVCVVGVRPDRA
jgi:hypothetical protein